MRPSTLVPTILAVGMLAAACGSDDDRSTVLVNGVELPESEQTLTLASDMMRTEVHTARFAASCVRWGAGR